MPALGTVSVSSISRGGASRRTPAKLPVGNALLLRTASRRHRPILLISTSQGEEFRWTTLPPTVGIRAPIAGGDKTSAERRKNLSRIMTKRQLDAANAVLRPESSKPQRRSTPATAAFALLENH